MRRVQIADLKNNLSAHLRRVRAGGEVLVCDRLTPIAKIVPLPDEFIDEDERSLVADGLLRMPEKPFDPEAFFALGKGRASRKIADLLTVAVRLDREESDDRILGRKRRGPAVRSRPSH